MTTATATITTTATTRPLFTSPEEGVRWLTCQLLAPLHILRKEEGWGCRYIGDPEEVARRLRRVDSPERWRAWGLQGYRQRLEPVPAKILLCNTGGFAGTTGLCAQFAIQAATTLSGHPDPIYGGALSQLVRYRLEGPKAGPLGPWDRELQGWSRRFRGLVREEDLPRIRAAFRRLAITSLPAGCMPIQLADLESWQLVGMACLRLCRGFKRLRRLTAGGRRSVWRVMKLAGGMDALTDPEAWKVGLVKTSPRPDLFR